MENIEKVEVLKTIKFGSGPNNTLYKGVILSGSEITPLIKRELELQKDSVDPTLRVVSSNYKPSKPVIELGENNTVFKNGKPIGTFIPIEEVTAISEKTEVSEAEPQGAPTRRGRSVSN